MSNEEERQRQMDFIVDTLAQISARFDQAEVERRADAVRIGRIEEAFTSVARLLVRYDERASETGARLSKVEDAVVTLAKLVEGRNGGGSA